MKHNRIRAIGNLIAADFAAFAVWGLAYRPTFSGIEWRSSYGEIHDTRNPYTRLYRLRQNPDYATAGRYAVHRVNDGITGQFHDAEQRGR